MSHHCHARGCKTACAPELLMCASCWRRVPKPLQNAVYRYYRKGQCDDKNPSKEWVAAARAAIEAVSTGESTSANAVADMLRAKGLLPEVQ